MTRSAVPQPALTRSAHPSPSFGLQVSLVILASILDCVGLLVLYLVTNTLSAVVRQGLFDLLGLLLLIAIGFLPVDKLFPLARWFYFAGLVMMLAPLLFGQRINGARSWITLPGGLSLQPIEPMKTILAICAATLLASPRLRTVSPWQRFGAALALTVPPVLLVAAQPEFGGVFVLAVELIFVLFVADLRPLQWLTLAFIAALAIFALLVLLPHWIPHYAYLTDRLTAFLHPNTAGDTAYQSRVAEQSIGSGGLLGIGLNRVQMQLAAFHQLPEAQNDFAFAVVGNLFGFVGCALVILCYLAMLMRMVQIGRRSTTQEEAILSAGLTGIFVAHVFGNIGMNVGLLPVMGIPLPFISSGGSAALFFGADLGLIEAIYRKRRGLSFTHKR
ncbi:MAG: FtsW/RodA/SpoVE family cell cycle protein [Firmicutes bacterium]|nr:FtsW/RodA/SpoVE family cell cycle protein [Bacillota bacterium]